MTIVQKPFISLVRFLKEVRIELKKVAWPARREVINYTILVIAVSTIIGIYLGVLDLLFQWVLTNFII
ncbi:MAG: preprotein translocase subunit SecE [Candidatus Spechtbacterales bacterium]